MMKEPNEYVSVSFDYTDAYGNNTCLTKTVDSDYMGETELGIVNELFHDFVMACGFTYLAGKRVEWVDDER